MFASMTETQRENAAINREVDADRTNLATIASSRSRARSAMRWAGERRLSDAEARHYAFAAMAALNHEVIGKGFDGKPRTVGPYVSHAVLHVLRDVDHTKSDLMIVDSLACAINVATRITVSPA